MVCNCNPETVCKKVCKRNFNGWISSPEFSLKVKDGKKATLTFTDVRRFSVYQVYNEFNKRTCYLEFEPTPEIGKHCQVAFNLCSSQYNEKTNIITFEVLVDKFLLME